MAWLRLHSPQGQTSRGRTSIPTGNSTSQIYTFLLPSAASQFTRLVFTEAISLPRHCHLGLASIAHGVSAFAHRRGLSRSSSVAGKCHLLSFKEGASDSAPGRGHWHRGMTPGTDSGCVRSWQVGFPSADLPCVLRGRTVPRLLALLGDGFVVVSPKQASEPLWAGSPVERNQGSGLAGASCTAVCAHASPLRRPWGCTLGQDPCEGQAPGRVVVPDSPIHPPAGSRVGLRLRTRDRTGEVWVTRSHFSVHSLLLGRGPAGPHEAVPRTALGVRCLAGRWWGHWVLGHCWGADAQGPCCA